MLNGISVGFTVCMKHLDNKVQKATSDILEDEEGCVCVCVCFCLFLFIFICVLENADRDRLFYTVYEKSIVNEGSVLPHLWAYRSRITLEHLLQALQTYNKKKECPILHQFLTEVCSTHGASSFL